MQHEGPAAGSERVPGPGSFPRRGMPGTASGRTGSSTSPKRRALNIEGAFPLLLIGSALLCYAAVLANEELSSNGGHLPLWGLVGAVGAVIAGAGIYSTFLVPAQVQALDLTKEWVTVPKAEWDALRARPKITSRPVPASSSKLSRGPGAPSRVPLSRPAWAEDWDVDSEEFRAAAAPPAPTDLVLRQIEEIESSLERKRSPDREKKQSG